jgi:hypothetical protein
MVSKATLRTYLTVSVCLLAIACTANGKIIYVDDDATGANNGSSWADAYNYLQDALADANSSEKPVEIRAAQGVYTPDSNSTVPDGTGNREATFQLINGVTLKGGHAGFGEPDPGVRDIDVYETILSGDLNGDDIDVGDLRYLPTEPTRAENSYNVVTSGASDQTAVLDGLTVKGGNTYDVRGPFSYPYQGGGMYNHSSSPTLTNCKFVTNSANEGGAMYNLASSPTLVDCILIDNRAYCIVISADEVGGLGGAMFNSSESNPTLMNCSFEGNSARKGGGAYNANGCRPVLINCAFTNNRTWEEGSGICNHYSSAIVKNCTFAGNVAAGHNGDGAGICNIWANSIIENCIFTGNFATHYASGGGGGIYNYKGSPSIRNCTFVANSAEAGGGISNGWSTPLIADCTFQSNYACSGAGIFNGRSRPVITNCVFFSNSVAYHCCGAAIDNSQSDPTITDCIFSANHAYQGGAVCNVQSNSIFRNCILSGNKAAEGAGMYNLGSILELTNCTFSANSADNGNAIACHSYNKRYQSNLQISNAILWDGPDQIWNNDDSAIIVTYSDVEGDWLGTGNISTDPCFLNHGYWDPNGTPDDANDDFWVQGDYHLKSQAGRWDANEGRWVMDELTSPCIDAGDPMSAIGREPFPNGGIINMGAYGGTVEASKSYFGKAPCETIVAGDINGDCEVNYKDFTFLALHWLTKSITRTLRFWPYTGLQTTARDHDLGPPAGTFFRPKDPHCFSKMLISISVLSLASVIFHSMYFLPLAFTTAAKGSLPLRGETPEMSRTSE